MIIIIIIIFNCHKRVSLTAGGMTTQHIAYTWGVKAQKMVWPHNTLHTLGGSKPHRWNVAAQVARELNKSYILNGCTYYGGRRRNIHDNM